MNLAGNCLPCDCNLSLVKLKLVSGYKENETGISFLDFNVKVKIKITNSKGVKFNFYVLSVEPHPFV